MKGTPDLILAGHGVGEALQVTVQAQALLQKHGRAYVLNPPPALRRWCASNGVECVDLSGYFQRGKPLIDVYLDVADLVLRKTHEERPVIVLMQDHPVMLNALGRFLLAEATQQGLTAVALPSVSEFDAVVAGLGLDVGSFGMQVFDARRFVSQGLPVNPRLPTVLLEVGGFLATEEGETAAPAPEYFAPLAAAIARVFPPGHAITLVNTVTGAHATVTVARFAEFVPHIEPGCCLFLDRIR